MAALSLSKERRMFVFRAVRISILVLAAVAVWVPPAASAASFDGVGNHTLTAANLGFDVVFLGAGFSCTSSVLEANVAAGGVTATVTNATFSGCTGTGTLAGPADVVGTNFPWAITRTAAGTFTIDGIHINWNFTSAGVTFTAEGGLEGSWTNTTHTGSFAGSTMQLTSPLGNGFATLTGGDLKDDQNTLAVT
jgi:hypothetical protein